MPYKITWEPNPHLVYLRLCGRITLSVCQGIHRSVIPYKQQVIYRRLHLLINMRHVHQFPDDAFALYDAWKFLHRYGPAWIVTVGGIRSHQATIRQLCLMADVSFHALRTTDEAHRFLLEQRRSEV